MVVDRTILLVPEKGETLYLLVMLKTITCDAFRSSRMILLSFLKVGSPATLIQTINSSLLTAGRVTLTELWLRPVWVTTFVSEEVRSLATNLLSTSDLQAIPLLSQVIFAENVSDRDCKQCDSTERKAYQ